MAIDVPDDWGLAGKVAIVTGGGAAGDGIGNGRAAAILLARARLHPFPRYGKGTPHRNSWVF